MLVVEHFVARSDIHNLGVFIAEPIAQGEVVWRYEPDFDVELSKEMVEALPKRYKVLVEDCAEFFADRGVYRLGNDADIFMNHCDQPNLLDLGDVMIAARAVSAGEELTCDYRVVRVAGYMPISRKTCRAEPT